jgi:hypothetical protein
MLDSLFSGLCFAALSIAAFGFGRPLLRWLGAGEDDPLTATVFSLGIGLVAAGCVLLALGLAGLLCPPPVAVLTMIGCCWGLVEIGDLCLRRKERLPEAVDRQTLDSAAERPSPPWPLPPRWLLPVILAAAAVVGAASLLDTLGCNPVSPHPLPLSQRERGDIREAPPLLLDLWHSWAVALEGHACAQLVHWGFGLLLMLATVVLATPLLGRTWAWIAGGLVMLTPAVSGQIVLPGEGVALAAFSTLALAAWWQAVMHGGDGRWFVVAGILAGGALGIHRAAAQVALPLGLLWASAALRRREQRRFLIRGGVTAAVIALAIGGSLLMPLRHDLFQAVARRGEKCGLDSLTDHVGIALLAAAPGLLLVRRLRGLGAVVFVAIVYAILVLTISKDVRLLLPAVSLLSVATVWVWIELQRFPLAARRTATVAFVLLLACEAARAMHLV